VRGGCSPMATAPCRRHRRPGSGASRLALVVLNPYRPRLIQVRPMCHQPGMDPAQQCEERGERRLGAE
jgi:hypothetical protein